MSCKELVTTICYVNEKQYKNVTNLTWKLTFLWSYQVLHNTPCHNKYAKPGDFSPPSSKTFLN